MTFTKLPFQPANSWILSMKFVNPNQFLPCGIMITVTLNMKTLTSKVTVIVSLLHFTNCLSPFL